MALGCRPEELPIERSLRHWLRARRGSLHGEFAKTWWLQRIYSVFSFIGSCSDHSTCLLCLQLTHWDMIWMAREDRYLIAADFQPWKMKIDFNQFCGPSAICSFCEGRALLYHQRRSFYGCERSLCRLAKVTAPPVLTVGKGQEGAEWLKWSLQMVLPQNGPNGVGTKM